MKFSAPIYILKQQAKAFARKNNIALHEALDRIAKREGFASWSLLAAKWRANPSLTHQVTQLKHFARQHRAVIVCLSQIHRSYDPATKPVPALSDIRLPNPLNLELFDKACLLGRGKLQVEAVT